jgi:hypothetical protein
MSILLIIMLAPIALFLGFALLRLLMEPVVLFIAGCGFLLFLMAILAPVVLH